MCGDPGMAMSALKKPNAPDHPLAARIHGRRAMVPQIIASASEDAARRLLEFFAATLRNKNTRAVYYRAVDRFFAWCEQNTQVDDLGDIEPLHVAAYIEQLQKNYEKPSVKQHLAASARASTGWSPARSSPPTRPMRCAGPNRWSSAANGSWSLTTCMA